MADEASSVLALPWEICRALLRAYSWDRARAIDAAMDSPSEAFKVSGARRQSSQPTFETRRCFSCAICCTVASNQPTLRLPCNQVFCLACHKAFYEKRIADGNVRRIVCPGSCDTHVPDETLQRVVSPGAFSK